MSLRHPLLYSMDTVPKDGSEFWILFKDDSVYKGFLGCRWCKYANQKEFITEFQGNEFGLKIESPDFIGWCRNQRAVDVVTLELDPVRKKGRDA